MRTHIHISFNKTKYFRPRLYYEVSKRAYRELRQTWERLETDMREIYEESVL